MNKELIKRILSSIVLIPLALFFIIKGSILFVFFISICFLIIAYEWHTMSKKNYYYFHGLIFFAWVDLVMQHGYLMLLICLLGTYFADAFTLQVFWLGETKLQFIFYYFAEPSLQAVRAETMVDGLPRAYR